jgi:hypothetical protein
MKRACLPRLRGLILPALLVVGMISVRAESGAEPIDADSPPPIAVAPVTDTRRIANHFREVIARPQFHETDEASVNSQLEDWLSQWFKQLGAKFGEFKYANSMPAFESLLMTLLVAFSISIVIYVMVRLTRRRGRMGEERGGTMTGEKTFCAPEFYDQEIQHAVQAEDWHTAWLAAWRQFLSRLEHRSLVDADRTRTNREYLAQLRGKALPVPALALLSGMVDAYDRFIYGGRLIGKQDWHSFHHQLDEAALMLHLQEKRNPTPARSNS